MGGCASKPTALDEHRSAAADHTCLSTRRSDTSPVDAKLKCKGLKGGQSEVAERHTVDEAVSVLTTFQEQPIVSGSEAKESSIESRSGATKREGDVGPAIVSESMVNLEQVDGSMGTSSRAQAGAATAQPGPAAAAARPPARAEPCEGPCCFSTAPDPATNSQGWRASAGKDAAQAAGLAGLPHNIQVRAICAWNLNQMCALEYSWARVCTGGSAT
jgi:hypothetical protein